LLSALYYVNVPATSATYSVTVNLTSPAPLVVHVFAVLGADVTSAPFYSPITDAGAGGASFDVISAPITVPSNALLLAWTKNDSPAAATAMSGFTLDAASTNFLWAESRSAVDAGSHTGDFQYNAAISWQTAVVGLKSPALPPTFTVTVLAANGGEKVFAGTPTQARWAVQSGTAARVDVALSRDNGVSFTAIPECTNLPGSTTSCNWTPTGVATTARIRVTARDAGTGSVADTSDAAFTIVPAPSVVLTAPNAPTNWIVGAVRPITWQHNLGAGAAFKIELSRNGGTVWETIAASVPSATTTTGSFSWTVTGPPTTTALVRVSSTDQLASYTSSVILAIVSIPPSQQMAAPPGALQVVVPADFDGNGLPDLLSQTSAGNVTIALGHGFAFDTVQSVFDAASVWRVVGVGDFNNDGHEDIVWQGPTGSIVVWLMNTRNGTQPLVIYSGESVWRVVGVADMDHDGSPDLVWQSPNGEVVVWFMAGASLVRSAMVWPSASAWRIVGVADFSGDGDPDLLWQGPTGALVLWTMHGSTVATSQVAFGGESVWTVIGVGDVDGDGKPDLVWQSPSGQTLTWLVSAVTADGFRFQGFYLNRFGLRWGLSTTPQ
jgi:hypothetical protein